MTRVSTTTGSQGSSNPEYVNARVRARRAALFDDEDYRKLMRMGPSGIARFMEESEYEDEINALATRHSGVDLIEYALNENLAKHFDDLLRWSDGHLHDLIAHYLRKYDAWNVKTLLRGVYTESAPDAIRTDFIHAGDLDADLLDGLADADSIEQVVDGLADTLFGEPLREAYEEYEAEGALVPLENAVDREFYEHLMDDVEADPSSQGPMALYAEFLIAEIDFLNARNSLRLARSGADMDPAAYFIEGGDLFSESEIRRLVEDTDRLVEVIRESKYSDDLGDALENLEAAESLIEFEHALDAALMAYADELANVDPVSIPAVLSFVLAKEREVENIRAIARGREVGLEEDEIRRELVMT